jgi:hypothetical protein
MTNPYYTDHKGRKEIDGDVLFKSIEAARAWNKVVDDNKKKSKVNRNIQ